MPIFSWLIGRFMAGFIFLEKSIRVVKGPVVSSSRRRLYKCRSISESTWTLAYEGFLRATGEGLQGNETSPLRAKSNIVVRMVQTQHAIELLIDRGHYAEAAVLTLTQLEMALDAEYIGDDVARSKEWIEHGKLYRAPWSVNSKITALRTNDKFMFGFLSAIKHGNPVVNDFAIAPIHGTRRNLAVSALVCAYSSCYVLRALSTLGGGAQPVGIREFIARSNIRKIQQEALLLARDAVKEIKAVMDTNNQG